MTELVNHRFIEKKDHTHIFYLLANRQLYISHSDELASYEYNL